jgi:hypothetical protein
LDIKFTVVFKGTTNKKMENFLAPIEVNPDFSSGATKSGKMVYR